MRSEIEVHFMHESGMSFIEIGKKLDITAVAAAKLWVKADIARENAKNKERVVYRKRLTVTGKKKRQTKLIEKMRTL